MEKFAVLCKNKTDLDKAIKKFKRMGAKWFGIFDIVDGDWFHGNFPVCMIYENGGICWSEEKPEGFNRIGLKQFLQSGNQSITIYQKDREVIAKNNATGKTATAKCHLEDEFDFYVGAKLALDRLIESEKFVPRLKCGDVDREYILKLARLPLNDFASETAEVIGNIHDEVTP